MTLITIPNRPAGTDVRSIEQILANFDAITEAVNGNIDYTNLASELQGLLNIPTVSSGGTTVQQALGWEPTIGPSGADFTTPVPGIGFPTACLYALVSYCVVYVDLSRSATSPYALSLGARASGVGAAVTFGNNNPGPITVYPVIDVIAFGH